MSPWPAAVVCGTALRAASWTGAEMVRRIVEALPGFPLQVDMGKVKRVVNKLRRR